MRALASLSVERAIGTAQVIERRAATVETAAQGAQRAHAGELREAHGDELAPRVEAFAMRLSNVRLGHAAVERARDKAEQAAHFGNLVHVALRDRKIEFRWCRHLVRQRRVTAISDHPKLFRTAVRDGGHPDRPALSLAATASARFWLPVRSFAETTNKDCFDARWVTRNFRRVKLNYSNKSALD